MQNEEKMDWLRTKPVWRFSSRSLTQQGLSSFFFIPTEYFSFFYGHNRRNYHEKLDTKSVLKSRVNVSSIINSCLLFYFFFLHHTLSLFHTRAFNCAGASVATCTFEAKAKQLQHGVCSFAKRKGSVFIRGEQKRCSLLCHLLFQLLQLLQQQHHISLSGDS